MAIEYRRGTEADISEAVQLFFASMSDLCRRTGQDPPPIAAAVLEGYHRHLQRTAHYEIAVEDGKIIALGQALQREALWYLSSFWVLPGRQRQGVGGPLVRRLIRAAHEGGARWLFVWGSPDPPAQVSYLRGGMLPGFPNYVFTGAPRSLPDAAVAEQAPLELAWADELDREVRASARRVDLEYLLSLGATARQVRRQGRLAGYYFVNKGSVGPVAWARPEDAELILTSAFRAALERSAEVRVPILGINHDAVRFCLAAGLTLHTHSTFLWSAPFGALQRYVPSGGILF